MSSDPVVLRGRVKRVTFESEATGFRVLKVELPDGTLETVVGTVPKVTAGADVHVVGIRVSEPRFGDQVKASSVNVLEPTTQEGLIRYLGSGMIAGIGERLARRLVDHFGDETLKVLDDGGDRLAEVKGISAKVAKAATEAWKAQRGAADAMVFLRGHDVPPALSARIMRRYGSEAVTIVERHPYRLAAEVPGVGFLTADRIAQSVGIPRDAPQRIDAGLSHVLGRVTEQGHTWAPRGELRDRAAKELAVDEDLVEESLDRTGGTKQLVLVGSGDSARVSLPALDRGERKVADRLQTLLAARSADLPGVDDAIQRFERGTGVTLAEAQRAAIASAAKHRVLVLTGGPGVGKTTIVRALLGLFSRAKLVVKLAAPTGRAAKRLSESTGAEATTIHRLLEVEAHRGNFQRNDQNPLECDALIVDEASMLDVPLASALFDALPDRARLVLVGDVDQLPSVGPGAVLRDLLGSGRVPSAALTTIFRQGDTSLIVEGAHRIREGLLPRKSDSPTGDFFILDRRDPEDTKRTVVELVTSRIPGRFGLDPMRDIQVLTPMRKGEAGVIALNEALQSVLNPTSPGITRDGKSLRVGDRVMQLKNDYEREVYNGDLGRVARLDPAGHRLVAQLDGRDVDYREGDLDSLALAYAVSIHKSQGSEYPAVVIPWLRQHYVMLSRNLLYTAVTRGKRLVVLVADPEALRLALADDRKDERRTTLEGLLRAASPLN